MAAAWSKTWTFFEDEWHEGNVPLWGVRTHAIWLGSSVFDGARAFEGTTPDVDLHCARVNASAQTMGLKPVVPQGQWLDLVPDGIKRFDANTPLYIRPMYWGERAARRPCRPIRIDPLVPLASTRRRCAPDGFSITLSPFKRPDHRTRRSTPRPAASIPTTPAPCWRRARAASTIA